MCFCVVTNEILRSSVTLNEIAVYDTHIHVLATCRVTPDEGDGPAAEGRLRGAVQCAVDILTSTPMPTLRDNARWTSDITVSLQGTRLSVQALLQLWMSGPGVRLEHIVMTLHARRLLGERGVRTQVRGTPRPIVGATPNQGGARGRPRDSTPSSEGPSSPNSSVGDAVCEGPNQHVEGRSTRHCARPHPSC
jgi:hypothetical protein